MDLKNNKLLSNFLKEFNVFPSFSVETLQGEGKNKDQIRTNYPINQKPRSSARDNYDPKFPFAFKINDWIINLKTSSSIFLTYYNFKTSYISVVPNNVSKLSTYSNHKKS